MVMSEPKQFGFPVLAIPRYGQTTAFPGSGSFGQDFLLGETVTVPAAGMLRKIGFHLDLAGSDDQGRDLRRRRRRADHVTHADPRDQRRDGHERERRSPRRSR